MRSTNGTFRSPGHLHRGLWTLPLALLLAGPALRAGGPAVDGHTVALWRFNEGTGSVAADASGHGNNGAIYSATWTDGKFGKALDFNGSSSYVEVPDSDSLNLSQAITIEMWFYPRQVSIDKHLLDSHSSCNYHPWLLGLWQNGNVIFRVQDHPLESPAGSVGTPNRWYHVAATFDTAAGMKLYIDGKLVASDPAFLSPICTASGDNHRIGARHSSPDQYVFDGIIDEVRMSDVARTADEVRASAGLGVLDSDQDGVPDAVDVCPATPAAERGAVETDPASPWYGCGPSERTHTVALWHFDEGTGSVAADASGRGNNGVIHNASWTDGLFGKALDFNGYSSYVEVPDSDSLNLSQAITIEMWFYPRQVSIDKHLLDSHSSCNYHPWLLGLWNNGNVIFRIDDHPLESPAGSVGAPDRWYYVAATFDTAAGMKLYIDGKLAASDPAFLSPICTASGDNHRIGARHSSPDQYVFDGIIDEVRMSNVARTADEVRASFALAVFDSDHDGVPDGVDICPATPAAERGAVVTNPASRWYGCGPSERDLDGDGLADSIDACPASLPEELPFIQLARQSLGCGQSVVCAAPLSTLAQCSAELAICGPKLDTCNKELASSKADLKATGDALDQCNDDLGVCKPQLATDTADLGQAAAGLAEIARLQALPWGLRASNAGFTGSLGPALDAILQALLAPEDREVCLAECEALHPEEVEARCRRACRPGDHPCYLRCEAAEEAAEALQKQCKRACRQAAHR